jgi:hypothetical protein
VKKPSTQSIAIAAATSPALWPPIPSATMNSRFSTKLPNASSFSGPLLPRVRQSRRDQR